MNSSLAPPRPERLAAWPRFVIVLCTHQGEAFLREQLASFVAQSHPNWALDIYDWASTDGTRALLQAFCGAHAQQCDVRVTLYDTAPGACASFMHAARTTLAQRADFDVLLFADQDDVWVPHKLAAMAQAWQAEPDLDLVYTDFSVIDEDGRERAAQCLGQGGAWGRGMRFGHPVALLLNVVHGMAMGMSRTFLTRWSAAWHNPDWFMHDWAMCVVAHLVSARVRFLPLSLTQYRRHRGNVTMAFWGWRKFFAPLALLRHARRYVSGVHRQYQSLATLAPQGIGPALPPTLSRWRVARTVWSGKMFPRTLTVQLVTAFLMFWPGGRGPDR